jgi:hypothetical protein
MIRDGRNTFPKVMVILVARLDYLGNLKLTGLPENDSAVTQECALNMIRMENANNG